MKKIAPSKRAYVIMALCLVFIAFILGFVAAANAHYYDGCKTRTCMRHVFLPHNGSLKRIHKCEAPGRWFIDGEFDGGMQFSPKTWDGLGPGPGFLGFRYAFQAPIWVQKYGAVILYRRVGTWQSTATWPRCGAFA